MWLEPVFLGRVPNFQFREIECKFSKGSRIRSKYRKFKKIEGSKNHGQNQVNPRETTFGLKNRKLKKTESSKTWNSTVSGILTV